MCQQHPASWLLITNLRAKHDVPQLVALHWRLQSVLATLALRCQSATDMGNFRPGAYELFPNICPKMEQMCTVAIMTVKQYVTCYGYELHSLTPSYVTEVLLFSAEVEHQNLGQESAGFS